MARGRGQSADQVKTDTAPMRALAEDRVEATSKDNLQDLFSKASSEIDPKTFLSDLRPGQRKLNDEQISQLKTVEEFGSELHKRIIALQQENYGDPLYEATQRVKEATAAHKKAKEQHKKITKEFDTYYAKHREEIEHYHCWKREDAEERKEEKRYRGEYVSFDEKLFEKGKIHSAQNERNRTRNRNASRKAHELDLLQKEIKAEHNSLYGLTYNASLRAVLGDLREIGGADDRKLTAEFLPLVKKLADDEAGDERNQRRFIRAAERFPKDWLEQMIEHRRRTGRKLILYPHHQYGGAAAEFHASALFGKDIDVIAWNVSHSDPYITTDEKELAREEKLKKDNFHSVMVHELVHYMESIKPELGRAGNGYRTWRAMQKEPFAIKYAHKDYRTLMQKEMREVLKDPEKVAELQELKDSNNWEWQQVQGNLGWQASEVLSTGMESMVPGSAYAENAKKDPRHQSFMLGCLALL